jgi:RNA polymerase sigma factor (sigma-70 family)
MARIAQGHRWQPADALDDLFVQHYASLVSRAQQLVGRDRQAAEDLVHDAYVRLALRQFDASTVHNVEAYLFTTLRNVHLSQVRRRQSKIMATASIIDYESAVAGLRSYTNEEDRQEAYDALCQVVRYACLRKSTSTAAGVLILRFFHGYYPGEIARVVRASEAAVAERLRMARAEARAYLADPHRVRGLDERQISSRLDARVHSDAASVQALQQAIFDARAGACLTDRALDRLYAHSRYARSHSTQSHSADSYSAHSRYADRQATDPLDATTLGHLVSCATCLDIVNRRLGLPLLADRDPADRLGRGGRSDGGRSDGDGGSGRATDLKRSLNARLTKARENHPGELQIAVNGLFVSSQAVTGPVSEQRLKILVTEHVGFIEIFDARDTCLLYLDVDPPPSGPVEQHARVSLSDGRQLSATLGFAEASPTLSVLYEDPKVLVDRQPIDRQPIADRVTHDADAARPARSWSLWPVPLRFVLAGMLLGVLLANPRQTLAAADYLRRVIINSIVSVLDSMRTPAVLPSRSVMRPAHMVPSAVPSMNVSSLLSRGPHVGDALSDSELSELALDAFRVLDDAGALTQEQIGVERGSDRRLHIDGLVESDARRRELIAALRDLPARRLRVALVTRDEAARRSWAASPSSMGPLRLAEVTRGREPAGYELVRRYLATHATIETASPDPTTETAATEAVRRFSHALLNRSLQARVHARALQVIVSSVSADEANRLSPEARATRRDLIRRHAEAFREDTTALRVELEKVFPLFAADDERDGPVTKERDVWRMAERLFELASAHDVGVRRAFTVAIDGSDSLQVGTSAFHRSLLDAERIAAALQAAMADASNP